MISLILQHNKTFDHNFINWPQQGKKNLTVRTFESCIPTLAQLKNWRELSALPWKPQLLRNAKHCFSVLRLHFRPDSCYVQPPRERFRGNLYYLEWLRRGLSFAEDVLREADQALVCISKSSNRICQDKGTSVMNNPWLRSLIHKASVSSAWLGLDTPIPKVDINPGYVWVWWGEKWEVDSLVK